MEKSEWARLSSLEKDAYSDRRELHKFGDKTKWPIEPDPEDYVKGSIDWSKIPSIFGDGW